MFKQVGRDSHLYVRPGETIWSIADQLNASTIWLKGGPASHNCPAHPSSSLDQQGDANNWKHWTSDGWYAKGEVLLRCPTHDAIHAKWLVEQGREENFSKEKVGALLCQEDDKGSCLLSLLDADVQQEVATWNREATAKIAHKLSLEFVQWLVKQRMDGHWEGKELGSVVWRKNKDGTVIFSQLDFETKKQVAHWSREETNKNAHLSGANFIQWLIKMALEEKWSKEEVGNIVCRKNANNQLVLATMDVETQKQAAVFNQEKTNEIAHLLSADFRQWLVQQVNEGKWDKEKLASAVCYKSPDKRPTLPLFAEEAQKQLAVLDKARTCQIVPWLSSNLQEWIYEEAREGRWPQEMVSKVLKSEEKEGAQVVSAKMAPGELNFSLNNIRF